MDLEPLLLLVTFVILLVLNTPIAFAIGVAAFVALNALGDLPPAYQVAKKMAVGVESFPLLAIPFFVLAGQLMGEGGMASRLMNFANAMVGSLRGGLSYVNTITCMLFGAISGSAAAAISSIGGFMIPEMEERGYARDFTVALTTTAATTGLLIPPSNIMIVYAVLADGVSVGALFIAGVLPGIVVGLLIMVVCFFATAKMDVTSSERSTATKLIGHALGALPSLLLVVIVLGGILGGIFSATEAAAIAVAYAFFVPAVHLCFDVVARWRRGERLSFQSILAEACLGCAGWIKRMPSVLLQAGKTTAIVMLLIGASQAMSWFLAYEQIPQQLSDALMGISDQPVVILLIINCLLLAVGTFLDMTPAVLIFTPIFLPVAVRLGMHPVHFGVMMIANLCIGLCTPPVGTCLFVGCSVGHTRVASVAHSMLPFYAAMILALALITYVAWISLALPKALGLL